MGLIAALTRRQEEKGFLVDADLRALSEDLRVPLYRLQGLVSFYPHFRRTPPAPAEVALCRDMSCHLNGGPGFAAAVERQLGPEIAAGRVATRRVSCLGRCDAAPAACVNETPLPAGESRVETLVAWARAPGSIPHPAPAPPRAWRCDPYPGPDARYGVLRDLMREAGPEGDGPLRLADAAAARVLATLKEAGLRGMGGAGFPTSAKWEMVRARPAPRHVVVNADESEPGTFKDRVLLAERPHLVLEGALIAALVTGASTATIYIRHEYEPERRGLEAEMERARAAGVVPDGLDLGVFVSPGGYILGEETALLEALEDRRGEPRHKPPFPVTHGLFGQPTVINNVETLAFVPGILAGGAEAWRARGRPGYAGLKVVALSGEVERPGAYEIEMGTPIAELIERGGGVRGGRRLLAIAPGGASSAFLTPDAAGVPLDFQEIQKAGSMLGSGAVVVVAEGTDLVDLATNEVAFFRNESCGKCVPCRVGSEKAVQVLTEVTAGRGRRAALELLPALGETMALTSICGLGQVALTPILSLLRHFPGLVESRLPDGTAPGGPA